MPLKGHLLYLVQTSVLIITINAGQKNLGNNTKYKIRLDTGHLLTYTPICENSIQVYVLWICTSFTEIRVTAGVKCIAHINLYSLNLPYKS